MAADIVDRIRSAPLSESSKATVRLEPSDAPGVYIVDEPEAHLHPASIASVRDWLTRLAESAATVFVATHSLVLLDSDSQLLKRVLVVQDHGHTKLRSLSGALADELADVSADLGLTKADLLLMARLVVFVEGPHDVIVLDEWFGNELRSVGIRVFPVHGVNNILGLVESELVAALGLRIATLSDHTDMLRARSRPQTREEHAIARLLLEAKRAGKKVHPVGLVEPDILYYLDETVCREVASAFPGWKAAYTESRTAGSTNWKQWVTSEYRLPLAREDIRRLAAECRRRGLVPAELDGRIRALTAYASEPQHARPAPPQSANT